MPGLKHKRPVLPAFDPGASSYEGDLDAGYRALRHADLWEITVDSWVRTVRRYEAKPHDVMRAWEYVDKHPIFWQLDKPWSGSIRAGDLYQITCRDPWAEGYVLFNPYQKKDRVKFWYEICYPDWLDIGQAYHAWKLDGTAQNFEKLILKVARKIWNHFGNDRQKCEMSKRDTSAAA